MIGIMSGTISDIFQSARVKELQAGARLFHTGDRVERLYRVVSGGVVLTRPLQNGHETVLQRAKAGDVLAEASIYTSFYHCDARALSHTHVQWVPSRNILRDLAENAVLAEAWANHLARVVRDTRLQSEIRSLRTVRERLDAWLDLHDLPQKGQWQSVADEIAVSREALYRELARRA